MENTESCAFESFDDMIRKKLSEIKLCLSESELISLLPDIEKKEIYSPKWYKRLMTFIDGEIEEYWTFVCSELLEKKFNELDSLKKKYSNSLEPKWRPEGGDPECFLQNYRIKYLKSANTILDDNINKLETEVRTIKTEVLHIEKQLDTELSSKLNELKQNLLERIKNTDQLIKKQQERIDILLEIESISKF